MKCRIKCQFQKNGGGGERGEGANMAGGWMNVMRGSKNCKDAYYLTGSDNNGTRQTVSE